MKIAFHVLPWQSVVFTKLLAEGKTTAPAPIIIVQQQPTTPSTPVKPNAPTPVVTAPAVNTNLRLAFYYQSDCLDVSGSSQDEGAALIAYPCSYQANQLFRLETVNTTSYRIVATHSNQCLYVWGASTQVGAVLQQLNCKRNGDTSELFQLVETTTNGSKLRNVRSGLCMKIGVDGQVFQASCATSATLFKTMAFR